MGEQSGAFGSISLIFIHIQRGLIDAVVYNKGEGYGFIACQDTSIEHALVVVYLKTRRFLHSKICFSPQSQRLKPNVFSYPPPVPPTGGRTHLKCHWWRCSRALLWELQLFWGDASARFLLFHIFLKSAKWFDYLVKKTLNIVLCEFKNSKVAKMPPVEISKKSCSSMLDTQT